MKIDLEKERFELLKMYGNLLRKARPFLNDPDDIKQIKAAFLFATDAHQDMRRKSGEPFIYHPVAVATIATEEIGLGTTSIIAALLHDVVEDTDYTLEDIEERFGPKVALIVNGLTKISGAAQKGGSLQAENFRKMLLTIAEDVRVVLIKIADRLHNMRTLKSMPKDKQLKVKAETEYIYAPLAHRLGLYNIKSELEDLSLKYSDGVLYDEISRKLRESEEAREHFTNEFKTPLIETLDKQGYKYTIKSRTKSITSIANKMKKQQVPFEEVFDLFAVRIIFDCPREVEKSTCWHVYSIVTDFYTPNVSRLRDWISMPKANGYESLHTTVMGHNGHWVEVQIRSLRMDEIAEKGYAAHWKYKEQSGGDVNKEKGIEHWLNEVRSLMENDKVNAVEFLDDFRTSLFNKEVFVFTPNGDLKVFPQGATVLDFAFDIHTEVGAKCLGAKINGKLVPLSYQLNNGDQIEILTANQSKANEGWLKIVRTSRARAKIKSHLKEDRKRVASIGREIIDRKFKQLKIKYDDRIAQQLRDFFNLNSETDLYYQVGEGIIEHKEIKKFKDHLEHNNQVKKRKIVPDSAKEFKNKIKNIRQDDDELVIGEDMDNVHYSIANCCNPIQGDDIFGFITINNGIKIHRTNCPNSIAMMANYGYRIIKARWASEKESSFVSKISIEGTDRIGLVNDVTRIITSRLKVNIRSISIDTQDGIFKGTIEIAVKHLDEFEKVITEIKAIEGIIRVKRFDN
ncbi:RelA/SpoT family protein [Flammeovirga yaeyamensis]|uniref:RelA/SpoT family protein n=1 Tax=Flammeovirga yaeyamensis TaxID=367791 RepID=A0AAX1N4K7_9BACT|nr:MULTISPECIES: RelA/SpoT family protein [Flammeovirga]ANQ47619.1 bifunctional (p)ppGpp synthetase/guanosine-3',5'-bis(diphosphate) 3'-pyrophosphohydrolase [Flammeovirga sp. MY04]MBB3698662.1 GTP pyrophosphokinase [Flammeovirga yaeyamensis]NMF33993.1 bifunctional (p)ppGpp synthetase/guanosine-3',5'-bis(diphosphate) 3'-pyrophosphohydrolase [Flammeovirga yaeyamensis]QWG00982.1 RelA/SpoT family protein [Flammeovirga yaeyamensis]